MSAVEKFVQCARDQVGKAYTWATAGPDTFDCSGLVAFCYERATGKTITRGSADQAHLGTAVSRELLQPGDIVYWGAFDKADHVGIVEGGGSVINALNEGTGVVRSDIGANYGMPYLGARRLFAADTYTPPPPNPDRPRKEQRKNERDRQRRRRRKA